MRTLRGRIYVCDQLEQRVNNRLLRHGDLLITEDDMPMRFLKSHRVVIVPREDVRTVVMLCNEYNLQCTEISRNEGEVMLMMSDLDFAKLEEINARGGHVPASWDGG